MPNQRSELDIATDALSTIGDLDERGRILLLIETQDQLNNGDAMAFFGRWLDAMIEELDIELPEVDPNGTPFD